MTLADKVTIRLNEIDMANLLSVANHEAHGILTYAARDAIRYWITLTPEDRRTVLTQHILSDLK